MNQDEAQVKREMEVDQYFIDLDRQVKFIFIATSRNLQSMTGHSK